MAPRSLLDILSRLGSALFTNVWQIFARGRTGLSAKRENACRRLAEESADAQNRTATALERYSDRFPSTRFQTAAELLAVPDHVVGEGSGAAGIGDAPRRKQVEVVGADAVEEAGKVAPAGRPGRRGPRNPTPPPRRRGGGRSTAPAAGTWAAGEAERAFGRHDDGRIVIDEVAGQLLGLLPLALLAEPAGRVAPHALLTGFVAFRAFDIAKPFPVRWAERRLPGGIGVMADDLVAGALAAAVVTALAGLGAFGALAG